MNRYHRQVYFPIEAGQGLKRFTDRLNILEWDYTSHSLDNIKYRIIDISALLNFIKGLQLSEEQIFEYYTEAEEIKKAVYRIAYITGLDIILVMGEDKQIITIYLNSSKDLHFTLKKELYNQT